MKSKTLLVIFYLCLINLYGQSNVNAYKYIIVPKKFEFQKTEDKHQLNSLTKFLFNKEGFITLFDSDKMPQELFDNPCQGLKVNTIDNSGMLSTKIVIELLDCRDTVVFTSIGGRSKLKEFKRAYQEAMRRAFESVKTLNYKYDSSLPTSHKQLEEAERPAIIPLVEGETLKEEVTYPNREELKSAKVDDIEEEKAIEIIEEVVDEDTTKNEEVTKIVKKDGDILYAQDKPFGFQLVDSAPRVVYLLQKTSIKDTFILKNKNGIIHKKNEKWVAEYYENDQLIQKELTIKF